MNQFRTTLLVFLCFSSISLNANAQSKAQLTQKIDALNAQIGVHNQEKKKLETELIVLTRQLKTERQKLTNDIRAFNQRMLRSARLAHYATPWISWQYPQQAGVLKFSQKQLQRDISAQEKKLDSVITLQNTLTQKQASLVRTGKKLTSEREKLLKTLNIRSKKLATRLKKTVRQKPVQAKQTQKIVRKGKEYSTPIRGHIFQAYNAKDDSGIVSKGITLTGRNQGAIKAAAAGKILYSGDFRTYGGLIILGTPAGVQFIYGGIGKAKQEVGSQVKAGDIIAHLPSGAAPRLYFEMRKNNKEANPKAYIK